jgi:RNA polymerase sigma factor (sigma-70 family)
VNDRDTDIGGLAQHFPATRCSILEAVRGSDAELRSQAFATLVTAYWKPVYKYIRIKRQVSNEDAKDLTQGFFTRALEKGFFDRFDPSKARFRTYLRVCLDGFVANERQGAQRLKRGGAVEVLSLDFAGAESELAHQSSRPNDDPDTFFRLEWIRNLYAQAVEDLCQLCETTGRQVHFELFERYDLEEREAGERITYEEVGRQFGLTQIQVTNYLAVARREFRRLVLERLRESTSSEEEFRLEARSILGTDV